ncbi:MAG: autotransporter-associated beta strand repeat-containing protein, partial [Puniceicoccales bacterium]|nr:autotransporter-associated beta strand repeat-containing protein [Puniceicoccales bacterium]
NGIDTIRQSSGLIIKNDGTLDISGSSGAQTLRGLSGDEFAAIVLGNNSLVLDSDLSSTYAGRIVGVGTFIKNGTGTLTLTSTSTNFSGGMIVNGGTVQIGDGNFNMGSTGTGPITLNNNAVLEFNHRVGLPNIGSAITGTGTVRNTGQGNTTLSGNNT